MSPTEYAVIVAFLAVSVGLQLWRIFRRDRLESEVVQLHVLALRQGAAWQSRVAALEKTVRDGVKQLDQGLQAKPAATLRLRETLEKLEKLAEVLQGIERGENTGGPLSIPPAGLLSAQRQAEKQEAEVAADMISLREAIDRGIVAPPSVLEPAGPPPGPDARSPLGDELLRVAEDEDQEPTRRFSKTDVKSMLGSAA